MGNVIEFLARLGEDASLRHVSDEALATMIREAELGDAVGCAMSARDPEALRLLMGQGIYFSTQMGDPLREEEEPEEDGDGDGEEDDEGEKSLLRRSPTPPSGPRR
jgi:hypothetical protein